MSRKAWRIGGILLLAALAALAALASPALRAAEEPVSGTSFGESIDVRVVNVEAVVTDGKGNRVRGLTAADFRLLVDGKEAPIEYFSEVIEGAPAAAVEAAPGAPAPAASLAPQGRSFLVFIDDLFSVAQNRDDVLKGIERDLARLGPADRMAIVAYRDRRLEILSDWTGDRAALAAVLEAARRRPANGNTFLAQRRASKQEVKLVAEALVDGDPDFVPGSLKYSGLGELTSTAAPGGTAPNVHSSLLKVSNAAVAALRRLAPPTGRRIMLLLSGGWEEVQTEIPLVVEANRLGYTLYPVSVAGIDIAAINNDAGDFGPSGSNGGFLSSGWQQVVDGGLELMARMTGGQAMLNSARLSALGRAAEDSGSYYWLGFTPQWQRDDHHRVITVEARREGLKVRSRRGFADPSRATEAALAARTFLLAGGDPKDKKLVIEAGTPVTGRSTVTVPVTVAVPIADLTPVQQRDGWVVEGTLALCAVDETESSSDLVQTRLRLNLKAPPPPGALARYRTTLKLRKAGQRLVVTVRDSLTGGVLWGEAKIGSE